MRKRLEAWLFADADGAPALIRRLVTENARAFAPLYALAFVCMGLVAATTGASAWVLKDVINLNRICALTWRQGNILS